MSKTLFERFQRDRQQGIFSLALKRQGSDLVAHGVPRFGHTLGLHPETEPLGLALDVLVADEEDVAAAFHAMEHVQPVARLPFQDLEIGMDSRIVREHPLQLPGSWLLGQKIGPAARGGLLHDLERGVRRVAPGSCCRRALMSADELPSVADFEGRIP